MVCVVTDIPQLQLRLTRFYLIRLFAIPVSLQDYKDRTKDRDRRKQEHENSNIEISQELSIAASR
jgi:hypothetical protein